MNIANSSRALFTYGVTASFLSLSLAAPVTADIVSTSQLASQAQIEASRADVTQLLARADIQAHMVSLGVDSSDVAARVDNMTAAELQELQNGIDSLPAGADGLGIVLTLVLIFLILDLAGVTDIFPGI